MKINKVTAGVLVGAVLAIAALAAWGDRLGMSAGALHWIQAAAGAVGALVMALLPKLFADKDGDGVPDIVEKTSAVLLALAVGSQLMGCGASVSDSQRTAYAQEVAQCEANERAIVARQGTSYAQDQADLEAERVRCDAARHAIETPDGGQ